MELTAISHNNGADGAARPRGRRPRVLFVTNLWPDDERPWHGTFIHALARSLEPHVELDVLPIRGYADRGAYARAAVAVAALNRSRAYDVVHAHYGHSGVVARLQVRAPLVLTYCGSDLHAVVAPGGRPTRKTSAEAAVFRRLASVCAATMTMTEEMAGYLPRATRARNHVIPHGVDLERFRPRDRADARRTLGWDADEPVAVFVGDPRRAVKNHPLAVATCERARRELPGLRLRVASGVAPGDVPLWLAASNALLFTSHAEGSPNAVKEAMAAELPVVSTAVGDVPDRLRALPGCHAGRADAGELAAALVTAVRHGRVPEARAAVAPLSVERMAERVLGVYRSVA